MLSLFRDHYLLVYVMLCLYKDGCMKNIESYSLFQELCDYKILYSAKFNDCVLPIDLIAVIK